MEKQSKKSLTNALGLKIIMFAIVLVVAFSHPIRAYEWDNIKDYDSKDRSITVSNSFLQVIGLDKIAKVTPTTPHVNYAIRGKDRLVAEFTIESYLVYKEKVWDGMKFYDLNNRDTEIQRNYKIRYKQLEPYDYYTNGESCKDTGEINKTDGKPIWDCEPMLVTNHGWHKVWKDLDLNADLPKGTLEIGIFADVEPNDYVEFIPTWFGISMPEYAVWSDSFNADLEAYWDFNSSSNLVDPANLNLTNNEGTPKYNESNCLIGNCGQAMGGENWKILANAITNWKGDMTFNMWVRGVNDQPNPFFLGSANAVLTSAGWNSPTKIYFSDSWFGTTTETTYNIGANTWFMITITRNDTLNGGTVSVYVNGTLIGSGTKSKVNNTQDNIIIGNHPNNAFDWKGQIDESSYWSRTLSTSEITDLFNGGAGLSYYVAPPNPSETYVTLKSPANKTISSINTVWFNSTANITQGNLSNATLYIWNGSDTYTNLTEISGFVNETYVNQSFYLAEGDWKWNVKYCGINVTNKPQCNWYKENWTLQVDTSLPRIFIYEPINLNLTEENQNRSLNYSVLDNVGNLNSCWYVYNGTNFTVPCAKNSSIILNRPVNLTFWANHSVGTFNWTNYNWSNKVYAYNFNWSKVTYGSSNEHFNMSASSDGSQVISAYLVYNGTRYLATKFGDNSEMNFTVNFTIPSVTLVVNKTFYWEINYGSEAYNTSSRNQTVLIGTVMTGGIECEAGYTPAFNFTFYWEANQSLIENASARYILKYGLSGNNTAYTLNGSVSNTSFFQLCINDSQPYYDVGYGEVQYFFTGATDRRYYIFSGTRATTTTVNIPIYLLETGSSTSFLVTAETTALSPYVNHYIGLLRWYPSLNSYKTVEIGKTDDKGQVVLRTKTEDVDYRFAIYQQDGTLVNLFSPVRLICQTNPCVYTLFVDANPISLEDWFNIQKSLTYNTSTHVFTFTWNDPSQASQTMNLTVWRDTYYSSSVVCNSVSTSYTGTVICDVTGETGTLRAEVTRTASPKVVIDQLIVTIRDTFISAGGGAIGLFIGSLLLITFALIGVVNPILVVILGIISLIPLYFLGNISITVLVGLGVIGGVVIHFMNRR